MIGAIIGTGLAAAGQAFNAVRGAAARRAAERELRSQEERNRLWYDRRFNEVGRERADAVRALERMRELGDERMRNARGRVAVSGGSGAVLGAEAAAVNREIGKTVGNIDASQEARRDNVERDYRAEERRLSNARVGLSNNDVSQAATAGNMASALGAQVAASDLSGGLSKSSAVDPLTRMNTYRVGVPRHGAWEDIRRSVWD